MAAVVKPVTRAAGSNSGRKSMRRCVRFGVVALALGSTRCREGQEEPGCGGEEGGGAGREGGEGELRLVPWRQGQRRWGGRRGAHPEACGLDRQQGARRDRWLFVLEDLDGQGCHAALEAFAGE